MSDSRIWELIARKFNGEISEEELLELNQLLQQPGEVVQLNELLEELHAVPLRPMTSAADERRSEDRLRLRLQAGKDAAEADHFKTISIKRSRKRLVVALLSMAAVVVVIIFSRLLWFNSHDAILTGKTTLNEVVTNADSKSTVYLPDGSYVVLNSGSRLSYNKDFGVDTREITLTGEAYFDIAKNPKAPLTVHAGNVDIRVKGTAFNVRAYAEDSAVEASLIRGVIEVYSKNDQERKILLRPNEKILIGKIPVVKSSGKEMQGLQEKEDVFILGKLRYNPADSNISEIAWIDNKLAFSREPFYSLAQKMERWYKVSIQFEDKRLMEITFTGSFERESLIDALDALKQIAPFRYKIKDGKVLIREAVQR